MFFDKYQALCKNAGISDTGAAEKMGFQRSVVTGWKKGSMPKNATLKIVADYFGVPIDYFDEDMPVEIDGLQKEIAASVANLPPERQAQVLSYIRFLKTEHKP